MRPHSYVALTGLAIGAATAGALLADGVFTPGQLILFAVLAGVAYPLVRWLEGPIGRAADFAGDLARGDFPDRLPEDEIGPSGDLYRSLNRLAEHQRGQRRELGTERSGTDLLLREMGEGVLALDSDGRVVRSNRALRQAVGASGPLEGRTPATIFRNPKLVEFLQPGGRCTTARRRRSSRLSVAPCGSPFAACPTAAWWPSSRI